LVSHGARVGVRVTEASALDRVREHLPPACRPARSLVVDDLYSLVVGADAPDAGVRRYHLLYVGASRLARSLELDEVLDALTDDMEHTVALGARRRVFVKAGVVGWRGRALVLLGEAGTGTTSLVTALVRAGATYLSDRYAVFDARGRAHPYPTAIRSHLGDDAHAAPPFMTPDVDAGTMPLTVGAIVASRYVAGAGWRARALTPGQTVLALLARSVSAAARPGFALRVLHAAAAGSRSYRVTRGDAGEVVAHLLAATEGRAVPSRSRRTQRSETAMDGTPMPHHISLARPLV
jgi:hypothetical protein